MKRNRILTGVAIVLAGGAGFYLNGALPIGTGYTAKYLCSQYYLAGRDPDVTFRQDVRDSHILFKTISHKLDNARRSVTAKSLGVFAAKTALYRDGFGCTLTQGMNDDELKRQVEGPTTPTSRLRPERPDVAWPEGDRVVEHAGLSRAQSDKLDKTIEAWFQENGPVKKNTFAVVVVKGGRVVKERYAEGFNASTMILGWSMTKTIVSICMGLLTKDGKMDVSLPAPVSEWQHPGDPRLAITTNHLLRMSSGLEFEEEYAPFSDATNMLYASQDMASYAAAKPLKKAPDTEWYYSSGSTNLLARLVQERVGGTPRAMKSFLDSRLFRKLSLQSALVEPDTSGHFVFSSYMFATARDWARIGLLLRNQGRWNGEEILSKSWVAYMTTPAPASVTGEYGAQTWLNADRNGQRVYATLPSDTFFLRGYNGQVVAVVPSRDIVAVRLGATANAKGFDREQFVKGILDAL